MFLIAKHYLQNSASHCHNRELRTRLANFAAESIQESHAVDHPYNLVCSCSHGIFIKFCHTVALKLSAFSFILTKDFVTKVTHASLVCINLKRIMKLPPRYNCTISCKDNVNYRFSLQHCCLI